MNFMNQGLEKLKNPRRIFLDDSSLHIQIAIVFGAKVLEHVLNLCRGNYDFLKRLPVPLLLYIISFLELEDIARLSQVSRRFETICDSNVLWENIVENLCDTTTPEMKELAQEMGWKQLFFHKQTLGTAAAPKEDTKTRCSEQKTN